ncbi:MAG: hypothetical protein KDA21_12060 [Phycisphaerales bacterium]|nr:hypothetical protein [Phycisphaerales bacterium]
MKWMTAILGCVAAWTMLVSISWAGGLYSARHGYSLDMPEGWSEIPPERIRESVDQVRSGSAVPIVFDRGMQAVESETITFPYVLVQVTNYASVGLKRQINEDEFGRVVGRLTGRRVVEAAPGFRGAVSDLRLDEVVLDTPGRRFVWLLEMSVDGGERVWGVSVGHFGRDAMVVVNLYGLAAEWAEWEPTALEIVDGFRFDDRNAYSEYVAQLHPTPGSGPPQSSMLSRMVLRGLMIAGAVGVLMLLKWLKGRR